VVLCFENYDTSSKTKQKTKNKTWALDKSLKNVQNILDELAGSIGGKCIQHVEPNGFRKLVVRGSGGDKDRIFATVNEMRSVVHGRYQDKTHTHHFSNEHERREAEKEKKLRKLGRGHYSNRHK